MVIFDCFIFSRCFVLFWYLQTLSSVFILPAAKYFSYLYNRHIISSKLVVAITFNDVVYMPLVNKSLFKPRHTSTINFKVVAAFVWKIYPREISKFRPAKKCKVVDLDIDRIAVSKAQ